jgi:hypothetical protein
MSYSTRPIFLCLVFVSCVAHPNHLYLDSLARDAGTKNTKYEWFKTQVYYSVCVWKIGVKNEDFNWPIYPPSFWSKFSLV